MRITKFYSIIGDDQLNKPAKYGNANYIQFATKYNNRSLYTPDDTILVVMSPIGISILLARGFRLAN